MLTACSALALAACGGGEQQQVERRTDTTPRIERAIADRLATRSDDVASLLDRGDACGAAEAVVRLRDDLTASISEIPDVYLEDLSGLVNEIQAQIPPCEQPPTDAENGDDDGEKGHEKEKQKDKDHKDKGHDDEGDE